MNYYPYNTKESSTIINSETPVNNTYDQLDLAPYLPQLSKEAHLLLAKAHMELANNIEGGGATVPSVENMNNTNILNQAYNKVLELFKYKKNDTKPTLEYAYNDIYYPSNK